MDEDQTSCSFLFSDLSFHSFTGLAVDSSDLRATVGEVIQSTGLDLLHPEVADSTFICVYHV